MVLDNDDPTLPVQRVPAAPVDAHGATLASGPGQLHQPPAPRTRTPRSTGSDPRRYVIRRELARGGMGRISIAEDTFLRRTVALKELLTPHGDLAARFDRELSLTSKLQHPSIVSIHDGGVWPSGEPYYVMKLVSGTSLDKVIAEQATADERMALLPHIIAVADALAYAHDVGIIHRDLKPANVLVGDFGETVVIDWGLAKDLRRPDDAAPSSVLRGGDSGETVDGSVMGTPAYMPPEQAHGDAVDARADVYAIGAMLYHMLAGAPPYTGRTAEMILVAVTGGPPTPIAERVPGVAPELATIVAKAMAARAEDRYATAAELAADLKRFQSGQLVRSHDYSAWQLVRRWIRKHRTAVTVAMAAAVALAAVGALSIRRIMHEQQVASAERQLAVDSRADAEGLLDLMLGKVRAGLQPLGKLALLDDVAREAQRYYERRPAASTEADQHRRVVALETLGEVFAGQGDLPDALASHRRATSISEAMTLASHGAPAWKQSLATSYRATADVLRDQGDLVGASAEMRESMRLATEVADAQPASLDLRFEATKYRVRVVELMLVQGDADGALVELRALLGTREAIAAAAPTNPDWQRGVATVHERISDVMAMQGDSTAALADAKTALSIMVALAAAAPDDANQQRLALLDHDRVGMLLRRRGDSEGALAAHRASLAIATRLVALDPTNMIWQRDLSDCHDNIGDTMSRQGRTAEALAELKQAQVIRAALVAKDPTNATWLGVLAGGSQKLGRTYRQLGRGADAIAELRKSRDLALRAVALDETNLEMQRNLTVSYSTLGDALLESGALDEALATHRASLAVEERLLAKDPDRAEWNHDLARTLDSLGGVQYEQHALSDALATYRRSLDIHLKLRAADPANHDLQMEVAFAELNVGDTLVELHEPAEAIPLHRDAIAIAAKVSAEDPQRSTADPSELQRALADALAATGDRTGALAANRASLALAEQALTADRENPVLQQLVQHARKRLHR